MKNINLASLIQRRGLTVLGVLIALILVAGGVALYFVNAAATAPSAADARIQSWVNELADPQLTPARHMAQQQLEEAHDAAVDPLISALHSSNATLRKNSAEMLGFIASARSADALRTAMKTDVDPAVRARAAWALGELQLVAVTADLEQAALLDRNQLVRENAIGSLVALRQHLADVAGKNEQLVSAFAVAPSQPNVVYLSEMQELSVSRDGGKTWSLLPAKAPSRISALAVSPANPNVIYAGTESLGLYKSEDGGTTWRAINEGLGVNPGVRLTVTAISIDPNNPQRVYVAKAAWVGTSNAQLLPMGLMLTLDGGESWQSMTSPTGNAAVTRLLLNGDKLYALVGDRVVSIGV